MREAVTARRLRAFMRALAAEAREPGRIDLTAAIDPKQLRAAVERLASR